MNCGMPAGITRMVTLAMAVRFVVSVAVTRNHTPAGGKATVEASATVAHKKRNVRNVSNTITPVVLVAQLLS